MTLYPIQDTFSSYPMRRMLIILLIIGVFLVSTFFLTVHVQAKSAVSANDRLSTYLLPGDNVFPEGISNVTSNGTFYVGSAYTGTIYRGHLGQSDLKPFLPAGSDGRISVGGMKVDREGHLYVCGAFSTFAFVYDTHTGKLIAKFDTGNPGAGDLVNDVVIAPNGDAYLTDSLRGVLYRIPVNAVARPSSKVQSLKPWLSLAQFGARAFLNGLVITDDGQKLIVAAEDIGKQVLVDVHTKQAQAIDLGGQPVPGDGLLLQGQTLYSMDSAHKTVIKVHLSDDLKRGTVVSRSVYAQLNFPTTMAFSQGDMLVVNAQIDKVVYFNPQVGHEALRQTPLAHVLPFTISRIKIP